MYALTACFACNSVKPVNSNILIRNAIFQLATKPSETCGYRAHEKMPKTRRPRLFPVVYTDNHTEKQAF